MIRKNCAFTLIVFLTIFMITNSYSETAAGPFDSPVIFDEVFEVVKPYIGKNLENIADMFDSSIPYRGSKTTYLDSGLYSVDHIGEYFGPVRIIWQDDSFPIKQWRDVRIGMAFDEVKRRIGFSIESNSANKDYYEGNNGTSISLSFIGKYMETELSISLTYVFNEEKLNQTVLEISASI